MNFFDALPVHLLQRAQTGWTERGVAIQAGDLAFVSLGRPSSRLLDYADEFGASIPIGGLLEVCLDAELWVERVNGMLAGGDLLIIDYGYEAAELSRFPNGTLMSYRQHAAIENRSQ